MAAGEASSDAPRVMVVDVSNEPRTDADAERMYAEALSRYEGEEGATYADLHYNLANVRDRLGASSAAEESYRAAIAANPNHLDARNNLGVLLMRRGDFLEAIDVLRDRDELLANFGLAIEHAGRREEAVEVYERAIALGQSAALTNLGAALDRLGLEERALVVHRRAAREIGDATSHFNLGNALSGDEAAEEYKLALSLFPDYADAHNNLGLLLKGQEALLHFKKASEIRPDPDFLCNLAACHAELGDTQAAVDVYEKVLSDKDDNDPDFFDARLELASLHQDIDESLKHAKIAVRLASTKNEKDEARALLRDLLDIYLRDRKKSPDS